MRMPKKIRWPEQLDKPAFLPATQTVRQWLKKMMRRARRRDGKLNQDDAVKKNRYRGWES
jgi:hypothetical protein